MNNSRYRSEVKKKISRILFCLCLTHTLALTQNYQPEFLVSLENEILKELNLARSNPQEYAGFLVTFRKSIRGNQVNYSFGRYENVVEGVAAVDEAIKFLRSQKPIQVLHKSRGMYLGAKDLGQDQSKNNTTGHRGSDGSSVQDRVNRYGKWKIAVGENLCYGKDTARQVVMTLIIDDGVKSRGHRKNIFNQKYNVTGIYCDTHRTYRILAVITFAGDFVEKENN